MVKLKIEDKFFEEEERWGHRIDRQMKEVWAIELDLYSELKRVCDKYDLRLAANAGTILGAVRHKGFIPWDDDLDFMMPRKDYEILCKVAAEEFKHPYFFENFHVDPHFIYGDAKLLNLDTTGYENPYLTKHGIFIDIFPLDAYIDDERLFEQQWDEAIKLFSQYQRVLTCTKWDYITENGVSIPRRLARLYYYLKLKLMGAKVGGVYQRNLFAKFEEVCQRYNDRDDIAYIGELSFLQKNDKSLKTDFNYLLMMDFEFTKIPIPGHYHEYLTMKYGDYQKPVKTGFAMHTFKVLDTSRPFTEVLKEKGIQYE